MASDRFGGTVVPLHKPLSNGPMIQAPGGAGTMPDNPVDAGSPEAPQSLDLLREMQQNPERFQHAEGATDPRTGSPIGAAALKGGGTAAGLAAVGRGISMIPHPAAKAVGGALSAAPVVQTALGALGGAAGEAVREAGTPGELATELPALAAEVGPSFAPMAARRLYHSLIGLPSEIAQQLKPIADRWGLKLDSQQIRADAQGTSTAGKNPATRIANQRVANFKVTEQTGSPTSELTPQWWSERDQYFKQAYGQIYSPQNAFTMPPQTMDAVLGQLVEQVERGPAAATPAVKSAINALFGKSNSVLPSVEQMLAGGSTRQQVVQALGSQAHPHGIVVAGDTLGALRSDLSHLAATATEGRARHAGREVISEIDRTIQSSNPQVGQLLAEVNPQYRSFATLRDLKQEGGVTEGFVSLERLGRMLNSYDPVYFARPPQQLHPLAEAGILGETFGLRSFAENAQKEAELGKGIKAVAKAVGAKLPGGVGAGLGYLAGGAPGGAVGYGAGKALDAARRGKPGQLLQMSVADRMRQPGGVPWGASLGAAAAGVE